MKPVSYTHLDRGTNLLTATNALPDIPVSRRLDEPNNETTAKTDNIDFKIEHKLSDGWKLNAGYSLSLIHILIIVNQSVKMELESS